MGVRQTIIVFNSLKIDFPNIACPFTALKKSQFEEDDSVLYIFTVFNKYFRFFTRDCALRGRCWRRPYSRTCFQTRGTLKRQLG